MAAQRPSDLTLDLRLPARPNWPLIGAPFLP
jgi:hypothetical protein